MCWFQTALQHLDDMKQGRPNIDRLHRERARPIAPYSHRRLPVEKSRVSFLWCLFLSPMCPPPYPETDFLLSASARCRVLVVSRVPDHRHAAVRATAIGWISIQYFVNTPTRSCGIGMASFSHPLASVRGEKLLLLSWCFRLFVRVVLVVMSVGISLSDIE